MADCLSDPIQLGGREIAVSASIGIVLTCGADTSEDLLRDADAAMYRAKRKGRAGVELFDEDVRRRALARLEIENALRVALDRGELRIHYQPKVRLDTGTIIGVEALVCWEHPTRGLLPPAAFIPLAEETGLVIPLGAWVLREACQQGARWTRTLGAVPFIVSVNLSRRQLEQPDLVEVVAQTLQDTGLEADRLCLEITETAVMRDLEHSIATLLALKELGVRIAIDDFGVGFSSLSQLKHLPPVDMLKIDKSFVDGISAHDDQAIVAAILSLAAALGIPAKRPPPAARRTRASAPRAAGRAAPHAAHVGARRRAPRRL